MPAVEAERFYQVMRSLFCKSNAGSTSVLPFCIAPTDSLAAAWIALLGRPSRPLGNFAHLVSYNGKTFFPVLPSAQPRLRHPGPEN